MSEKTKKDTSNIGLNSLNDPFDPDVSLKHDSHASAPAASVPNSEEAISDRVVENTVVRAIFGGNEVSRRSFMKLVGSSAAIKFCESAGSSGCSRT